jgi:hypothetical protein
LGQTTDLLREEWFDWIMRIEEEVKVKTLEGVVLLRELEGSDYFSVSFAFV